MVLGSHLDTDLQVLADVGRQHGPEALQRVLHRQRAKEVHQPLEVEEKMLVKVTGRTISTMELMKKSTISNCFFDKK